MGNAVHTTTIGTGGYKTTNQCFDPELYNVYLLAGVSAAYIEVYVDLLLDTIF
jgi:hypothetical protein